MQFSRKVVFYMKSYYIHFFRNGATVTDGSKQYIGSTDVELSTNGIEELEELREKYDYMNPVLVFTSPLKRCVDTAKIIFKDKKIVALPELRECDFGDFEGKTPEELIDDMRYNDFIRHSSSYHAQFCQKRHKHVSKNLPDFHRLELQCRGE